MRSVLSKVALMALSFALSAPAYASSVTLQGSTPGTPDSGNINVTGTIIGTDFQGSTLEISSDASIGGILAVNTIDPTGSLTIGDSSNSTVLQGGSVSVRANSGGYTNTLTFASPSGSNNTITLPNSTGTVCLDNNNCSYVRLGTGWPTPAQAGTINIGNYDLGAGNIHVGLGDFSGTVSTNSGFYSNKFYPISTGSNMYVGDTSTPLRLKGSSIWLSAQGASGDVTLKVDPGTGFNKSITFPNSGGSVCVGNSTDSCATLQLSNLSSVAINTSLLPASSGSANLGSNTKPFGQLYVSSGISDSGTLSVTGSSTLGGTLGVTGNTTLTGSLSIGGGTPITKHLSATASESAQSLSSAPGCNTFNITVTGASMGDTANVGVDQTVPGTWMLTGNVSAADTVTVKACAFDTATTISAGTYRADVWKH